MLNSEPSLSQSELRVSHLLEQERGRWRKLYMAAALNAAFTAQPATTDPAAPEPMMSGAGLAESNGTASEAADEPADCDPGGGTLTEGTVCSDLSEDTYLPPECRHDEKHIRKFKDREARRGSRGRATLGVRRERCDYPWRGS